MAAHVWHSRRTDQARRRTQLDEHLPVDHRLSRFYRVGAGLMGLVLVAFGILGLIDRIGFFDTRGDTIAGLNTNGALSVLSITVGLLLFVGMVIGGNFASTLNMVLGILFILSGFVNLALLDRSFNPLAFRIPNVLFSFVVGLMLMFFGMYGRVSAGLPHDNPYWMSRHPEEAEREQRASRRRADLAARQSAAAGAVKAATALGSTGGPPTGSATGPVSAAAPVSGAAVVDGAGDGRGGVPAGRATSSARRHSRRWLARR